MSFGEYCKHGWVLCPVPRGSKGPVERGWNLKQNGITNPAVADQLLGAGLLHAFSGTMALDVDHYEKARDYLLGHGIDLDGLMTAPDSVQLSSGRVGRAKLLYKLPRPLASVKLAPYKAPGKKNPDQLETFHALELRCANATGSSVQDVLAPSLHPETCRPYKFVYGDELTGDWRFLPELPKALHDLWISHLQPAAGAVGVQAAFGAEAQEILKLLADQDPSSYDTWIKVGFAVHHETGGSNEGLAIYDEWSRKSSKYEGRQAVEAKWRSFRSDSANAVTLASLRSESVAKASDFTPVAAPAASEHGTEAGERGPAAPDVGEDTRPDAVMQRLVGDHVVYVRNVDQYFDLRTRDLYQSDRAVRNNFSPLLPAFEKQTKKGIETYKIDPVSWLQNSRTRRERDVYGIAMHPGNAPVFVERGRRFANSYALRSGCAADPAVQALVPKPAEREAWNFLWGCIDSPVFASWLKKFYAHALKHPGVKIRSAPLLVSVTTGTGKTTLMSEVPRILFGHVEQLTEAQIRGTHNGELLNTWWATIEEIYAGNTKSERRYVADRVKPWITNDDLTIRKMCTDAFTIVNRLQTTASSNHMDAMSIDDEDERRWGVGSVRERQWSPAESLSLYGDLLATERAPGVLKWFMQQESLTGFHPAGKPPVTTTKRIMVMAGLGHWESTLIERMAAQEAPFDRDLFTLQDVSVSQMDLTGLTPHKLARMLRGKPFFCEPIMAGRKAERHWAWRNQAYWRRTSEQERVTYMQTGVRPRPGASDDLPPAIATMRAEADEDENCDLI